jgi:hypothetical protein
MPPALPAPSDGIRIVIFASISTLSGGGIAIGVCATMPALTAEDGIGSVPPATVIGIISLGRSTVAVLGVLGGSRPASMD